MSCPRLAGSWRREVRAENLALNSRSSPLALQFLPVVQQRHFYELN